MINSSTYNGHSAQVNMELIINGISIPVVQMGPDFILLDKPSTHPPSEANLLLEVDQHKRQWKVYLPDGLKPDSRRVSIAPANNKSLFSPRYETNGLSDPPKTRTHHEPG